MLGLRAGFTMFCDNSKVLIGSENLITPGIGAFCDEDCVIYLLPLNTRLRKYTDDRIIMSSGHQIIFTNILIKFSIKNVGYTSSETILRNGTLSYHVKETKINETENFQ